MSRAVSRPRIVVDEDLNISAKPGLKKPQQGYMITGISPAGKNGRAGLR